MIFSSFNKILKKSSKRTIIGACKKQQQRKKAAEEEETKSNQTMTEGGYCCSTPSCLRPAATDQVSNDHSRNRKISAITTTRTCRSNFAKATTSTLFPDMEFTNPESLPSLSNAFSSFTQTYPPYIGTQEADMIRERNYPHLSSHVCLDYTGYGLFSHSQSLSQPDFFATAYKPESLASQVQYGCQDAGSLESAIRNRIMSFLGISHEDYTMVCTANRTSAFKLLAETYPFHSNNKLLTVYDYESEDARAMAEGSQKRGAKVMSANFSWPGLRIHSAKLKRMLRKKKRKGGLFVFPLQSRMSGVRYPYAWMRMARENGWDVLLDACALGSKDMDSFGLSLIRPDFIICSFFKIVGENPSGFASLLIKKSRGSVLETSVMGRSIGVVSIVPARSLSQLTSDVSGTLSDTDGSNSFCNGSTLKNNAAVGIFEQGETSAEPCRSSSMGSKENEERMAPSEIMELESESVNISVEIKRRTNAQLEIECSGLDHADSLGLLLISSRLRYITNWLVIALMKLRHPNSENGHNLVRIYGPRIKFERGPAIAFNVFDWKGERIDPALVQKLADRSNISLNCGFLRNIYFSDKYEGEKDTILERRNSQITVPGNKKKEDIDLGIAVLNATLGFLTNFEDAYKLWSFVAKFLDADFVEKERWRYMALNQKMIEV